MAYWQGKIALITGGSAGLGKALGKALAGSGASVMLAAREGEKLQQAVSELTDAGLVASGFTADVTRRHEVDALIAATIEEFGQLDCLINNVGRSTRGKALETSADEFRELLEVNFLSVVNCTQAAADHLCRAKGHLVNIGSLASKSVSRYLGAYPPSKFAVAAYTQQLRYELGPEGVHVMLVCPGPIARADAGSRYDEQVADLSDVARQPGGGVKVKGIDADKLAVRVLSACQKRQLELIVPARARWLFAISQLWPSLGDRIIHRMSS
ncbi:MAG: hypothetical protein CMJ64_07090 [Planctomycetaceae bacterium]|nr:hypothetical protein [Planctomycetaceae bacterium]